jgi:hypothetical protein
MTHSAFGPLRHPLQVCILQPKLALPFCRQLATWAETGNFGRRNHCGLERPGNATAGAPFPPGQMKALPSHTCGADGALALRQLGRLEGSAAGGSCGKPPSLEISACSRHAVRR